MCQLLEKKYRPDFCRMSKFENTWNIYAFVCNWAEVLNIEKENNRLTYSLGIGYGIDGLEWNESVDKQLNDKEESWVSVLGWRLKYVLPTLSRMGARCILLSFEVSLFGKSLIP